MLQVSSSAASMLANVRVQRGLADDVGIRISAAPATDGNGTNLRLGFVEAPLEGDQVTETEGTRVFVAPELAEALDTAMLDTAEDSDRLIITGQD